MSFSLSQTETAEHRKLRDCIASALGSWRRFVIAIDGVDGSGKTTLGRYLSWQIGASLIETDLFLVDEQPTYRLEDLRGVLSARLDRNRPILVEGLMVLETLSSIGVEHDYLLRVVNESKPESARRWQAAFERYFEAYSADTVDHLFSWSAT